MGLSRPVCFWCVSGTCSFLLYAVMALLYNDRKGLEIKLRQDELEVFFSGELYSNGSISPLIGGIYFFNLYLPVCMHVIIGEK